MRLQVDPAVVRRLFIRALVAGHCVSVDEVYALVSEWTGLDRDTLVQVMWGRET